MKHIIKPSGIRCGKLASLSAVVTVSALVALPGMGSAQTVTLSDINSQAEVVLSGASAGMNSWNVDGGNHLQKQWFYYRVGTSGLAAPIQDIGAVSHVFTGKKLDATYTSAAFDLKISYTLNGGATGSGESDILESIMVNNKSGAALDFQLFQYSNFDLGTTPGGDSVDIYSGGSGYEFVSQYEGSTEITETITDPPATRAETAIYDATIVNLTTVSGYVLNNNLSEGPGDVTWSLQWDKTIGTGESLDVFKDKGLSVTPIPEPSAMALVLLGAGVCGWLRRRK